MLFLAKNLTSVNIGLDKAQAIIYNEKGSINSSSNVTCMDK